MTTTIHTITDEQIEQLRAEQDGSDLPMTAICDRALGELDETRIAQYSHPDEIRRALAMTKDEARVECARVIADAEAMAD